MTPRDPLSETLQRWQPAATELPQFPTEVWARIEARRGREGTTIAFSRWALPFAACLALAAGAGFAMWQTRAQHTERMALTYAQSIDPLQMHAEHLPR